MDDVIKVQKVFSAENLNHVFRIRNKVFVEEQNCPPGLERSNEEESHHFLASCNEIPCGAARWRQTDKGIKLERFAVLPEFRKKGIGKNLLDAVLADIPKEDLTVYLNAQLSAQSFYSASGFIPIGKHFEEAGIMHQQMRLAYGNEK